MLLRAPPLTRLDYCECKNIGWLRFLSWVAGTIRAVDAPISLPDWIEFVYNRELQRWEESGSLSAA